MTCFFYIYIYILFLQIHGFQHFEKRSLFSVKPRKLEISYSEKKETKTTQFDKNNNKKKKPTKKDMKITIK